MSLWTIPNDKVKQMKKDSDKKSRHDKHIRVHPVSKQVDKQSKKKV
jgi:hypothetical protein